MNKLDMWLWLCHLTHLSPKKIYALYTTFGSIEEIYNLDEHRLRLTGFLNNSDILKLSDKSIFALEDVYKSITQHNIKVVTIDSDEYPESLLNLDVPPCVLYTKGKFIDLNRYPSISIVGSRRPSQYGAYAAEHISRGIAQKGYIVISGLADGIDSFAHLGAVKANMPTVAVLGCGIDIVYPSSNTNLAQKILKDGMIISEYAPGTPPAKHRFPERNRIIAALSLATAVIEANEKSGSLITSKIALELGKDIFALPGNITSPRSDGTNALIRDGAYIVTKAEDITSHYESRYKDFLYIKDSSDTDSISDNTVNASYSDGFDKNNVSESILTLLQQGNMDFDTISSKLTLSQGELSAILLGLELDGKIVQYALNVYGLKL